MIRYTSLKNTDRQNLREVMPLQKPFTVLIEPSSLCNFKCIQCFQSIKAESYFTRTRGNMPMARFRRVMEQLKAWPGPKLKVLKLSLYGEPLVNRDFCEMLRMAREADVAERMETTTNASLLTREIAEKWVEHQMDYARVSIYASEQGRHKAITGSSLDIRTIHENLRVLQEIKRREGSERPFVSCKMLDAYGDENERFFEMYRDVADEVYLDKPHCWIKVEGADFIRDYYREDAQTVLVDLRRNRTRRVACPMAFTTMAIRSNGDVSPCCVDFIGGTNLGRVDDHSLQEIWHSEPWYEFQKMQLMGRKQENESCARCDFYLSDHYTLDNIDGFDVGKLLGAGECKTGGGS
ncbi:MAG TPA: radical SAM/SPASM domain-containing protein [Syntrophales bacterium]|nr:radical SAM/SPASM domain-containing protein [Syntrophales bacterium]